MPGYAKTKSDWIFLNDIEMKNWHGDDACTDYVEITGEVFDLMANPTKKLAQDMYDSAIRGWFDIYDRCGGLEQTPSEFNRRIEGIRDRHCV